MPDKAATHNYQNNYNRLVIGKQNRNALSAMKSPGEKLICIGINLDETIGAQTLHLSHIFFPSPENLLKSDGLESSGLIEVYTYVCMY